MDENQKTLDRINKMTSYLQKITTGITHMVNAVPDGEGTGTKKSRELFLNSTETVEISCKNLLKELREAKKCQTPAEARKETK